MDGFDFIGFIAVILLVTMAIVSVGMAVSVTTETYEGLGQRGESGLVIAGSGEDPANAAVPEVTETAAQSADRWHITSAATEETTAVDSNQQDSVAQNTQKGGKASCIVWLEILCALCLMIIGTIAVGIWLLVRQEFGHKGARKLWKKENL